VGYEGTVGGGGMASRMATYAERHPLAARLEAASPSPELVAQLHALDPADCDDPALLEVVAGWERVLAWATARQARALEEMTHRVPGSQGEFVADDVAARLGITRRLGQSRVTLALGLAAHPQVADALAVGAIDPRKAEVLLADTEHLPGHVADEVLDGVLGEAPGRTVPQLRADLREAELALHPVAAAQRHEVARRERCVRMVPAPDAMAWVHAFLPAADAVTVMTGLDALAAPGRGTGGGVAGAAGAVDDPRTADQRRADALGEVLRRVLDAGVGPDGTPLAVRQHRRPHLHLTVSAAALASGDATGTAHLAGYGLVPLVAIGHLIAEADLHTVAVDPATGERLGDCVPVRRAGPVSRSTAGSAQPGSSGYRPMATVVRQVVDRDVTCRFPGCRVPSWRCDVDHVVPFDPDRPAGEQTVAANLQALCRHHHRLKTLGRWRVARDPVTGTTTWNAPTGRVYRRSPERVEPEPAEPPRREPRPTTPADVTRWAPSGGAPTR